MPLETECGLAQPSSVDLFWRSTRSISVVYIIQDLRFLFADATAKKSPFFVFIASVIGRELGSKVFFVIAILGGLVLDSGAAVRVSVSRKSARFVYFVYLSVSMVRFSESILETITYSGRA